MIRERVKAVLANIPSGVRVVAATKTRAASEIHEAAAAGIRYFGENYVQEAEEKCRHISLPVEWHMLGHIQKNKVKRAVAIFDMVQSLDSVSLAERIDRECARIDKAMPVLVEINSGREPQKSGIMPEELDGLVSGIFRLSRIRLCGLMTMGPLSGDTDAVRTCFRLARSLFEAVRKKYPENTHWQWLSMGMSDSYKIALEEGANMVRLGTILFGSRNE